MSQGDGDGWVDCRCGSRHWGVHGAAGLLLLDSLGPDRRVLLQLRAAWTHQGGTWSLPGGAQDSHEDSTVTALREAAEEAAVPATAVRVLGTVVGLDHEDWRYTYVIAVAQRRIDARVVTSESVRLHWEPVATTASLPLHAGLAAQWPRLLALIDRLGGSAQQAHRLC